MLLRDEIPDLANYLLADLLKHRVELFGLPAVGKRSPGDLILGQAPQHVLDIFEQFEGIPQDVVFVAG